MKAVSIVKWGEPLLLALTLTSSGFNAAFQVAACVFIFVVFYLFPPIYIKPAIWVVFVTINLWEFTFLAIPIGLLAGILRAMVSIVYYSVIRKEAVPFLVLSWNSLTFPLTVSLIGVLFLLNTGQGRTDAFIQKVASDEWKKEQPKIIENKNNQRIQQQKIRIVERYSYKSMYPCSGDRVSNSINNNLFEGLMTLDGERLRDGVAQKVDVSPDKMIYTFHLKPNAKWSDGKPVTAYDFEYGWNQITGIEEEYKALSPDIFEVKLKQPNPDYLKETAGSCLVPMRKDIAEKYGDKYLTEAQYGIYNGAFMATGSSPYGANLVPNPHYWDKNVVKLKSITIEYDDNQYGEDVSYYEAAEHDREVNYIQEKQHLDKYKNNKELHLLSSKQHGYLVQPYVQGITFDKYDRYYLKYAYLQEPKKEK